jgi:hypothetical protein
MDSRAIVSEIEIHVVSAAEQGPPGPPGADGVGGGVTLQPLSVFNFGSPEILFHGNGDVVMTDAS